MDLKRRRRCLSENCKDNHKVEIKKQPILERLKEIKPEWLISFEKFIQVMYQPTDAASLGVCRMLFGKTVYDKNNT